MPKPKQVRVTIALDSSVYSTYKEMADITGLSFSRTVSEWLGDTEQAAKHLSLVMQDAKLAPARVLNELMAVTSGVRAEILDLKQVIRAGADGPRPRHRTDAGHRAPGQNLPSSNTGVKVPPKGRPNAAK